MNHEIKKKLIGKHNDEKLRLFEKFFKIMDIRDNLYSKLVDQMMCSITLKEENERMAKKIENQKGWIKELENTIPKLILDNLKKRYAHLFHVSESRKGLIWKENQELG